MGFHTRGMPEWTGPGSLKERLAIIEQEDAEKRRKAVEEQLSLRISGGIKKGLQRIQQHNAGAQFARENARRRALAMTAEELNELLHTGKTKVAAWSGSGGGGRSAPPPLVSAKELTTPSQDMEAEEKQALTKKKKGFRR